MKKENEIVVKCADAAYEMFEALGRLIEEPLTKHLQNAQDLIMKLLHQMQQIETKQQQFQYDLNSLKQQSDVAASMNALLENAGKTNYLLSQQHYDEHITQPVVRSVFPVFDIVYDAISHCDENGKTDVFDAILSQLEQFLDIYDVKIIKHTTNDGFNPKQMRPIEWVITEDSRQDGLVAESMQIGFCQKNERMLRLETVSLFKYRHFEIEPINPNQGAEQC